MNKKLALVVALVALALSVFSVLQNQQLPALSRPQSRCVIVCTDTPDSKPTDTPAPTSTPESTSTPRPTATPKATPTDTPEPEPTDTPTLRPTPTPELTSTPRPTPTGVLRAFPSAEGFGAESVGGRGGRVIEVTNLNDSGPGSLRAAVEADGPRVVVFRIGGTIELQSTLRIAEPFITIAGQTAPGGGITLKNDPSLTGDSLRVRTHDVVIRYIRSRPGPPDSSSQLHALQISGSDSHDIIIDHCSFSWGIDEVASVTTGAHDVSLQWSIFSEGLDCSSHPEGCHSAGPFLYYAGTGYISYHHNVAAHSKIRQPYVKCAGPVDVVNNISYNPSSKCMHVNGEFASSSHPLLVNFVGNYLKQQDQRACPIEYRGGAVEMFFDSNVSYVLRPDSSFPESAVLVGGGTVVPNRHDMSMITTHSCESIGYCEAYYAVLAGAGANVGLDSVGDSYWRQDAVDERIINDVRNGTGDFIDDPSEVGGWPELAPGVAYADTDHDGMADEWETLHFGNLNRGSPSDSSSDFDGDGYTDLEEFLNGTNPKQSDM